MLEFFKIAKSTYFYAINIYSKVDKDIEIKDEITSIFKENKYRYGYRRITLELRNRGIIVNHKKVKRLMRELGLYASIPTAKYKSYKGEIGKKAPNLLLVNEIDENGEIIESGYQDMQIANDGMYYIVALPKSVDYNSNMVRMQAYDDEEQLWVDYTKLPLTSDPETVANCCDEVGVDISHINTDLYTVWVNEDICTGSKLRYIIEE